MQSEDVKFSIITPTFNRPNLAKKAIKSLLQQTYNNWEILIIDDSTNNLTKLALKKFLNNKKIKYFKNKKNMGANFSRNIGLENAGGDFIIFLDDDDILTKNCLAEAYRNIKKFPQYSWFVSDKIDRQGKKISQINKYNQECSWLEDTFLDNNVAGDCFSFCKKSIIGNLRYSTYFKNGAEWEFGAKLGKNNIYYTYEFPSLVGDYLNDGLTNNLFKQPFFLFKNNLRMLKVLPKIYPQMPKKFLYLSLFATLPPFLYLYLSFKYIFKKNNKLLKIKKKLTKI